MANGSRTTFNTIIFAAVTAILASSSVVRAEETPGMLEQGKKIYERNRCETCHGKDLKGNAAFPNLTISSKVADKAAFTNIVTNGNGGMPAFKDNAAVIGGIDALYEYVHSHYGK